jgi:hypothetical protein
VSGPVDQGQTYRYRHTVKDSSGTLANAGTVVVTITLPDGTTTAPTVVNSSTGVYDIAYTTVQTGKHDVSGSVTGGVLGTEFDVWEDSFTVEQPLRTFVGVDEASAHLRAQGVITTDADREQLRWLCFVASDAVERDLDRIIARRTVIENHDGGKTGIKLRSGPIISITSVVESGTTLTGTDYVLDSNSGVLWRGSASAAGWWAYGRQLVVVTFVAGFVNPPAAARMVALYLVQAMWQSSQQAPHSLLDEGALEGANLFAASLLTGLPQPLRNAYSSLQSSGVA